MTGLDIPQTAPPLSHVLSELVASLPETHLTAWIRVLRTIATPDERTEARLATAHPGAGIGPRASLLVTSWMATNAQLPGSAVALALEAASHRYEQDLASHHIEIVVSGPVSDSVPIRLTASVAVKVIRAATSRLLITSYAAFGIREIVSEIWAAAERGVSVDLILETARSSGGKLGGDSDGRTAFHDLRFHPDVHLWQWANDQRHGPGGRRGSMHAKVIAADRAIAFLGSANLTDNAYTDNLEIGAIIHDLTAVANLVDHFTTLMRSEDGPLTRLSWSPRP
ncbi:hypothetical protein Acor_74540 [Acrocarpospora corrugata]|uniref:PLD phosphodiesterase domain-containing protein n=1 Tax=Acrocarpospora corrugata TaxID=35763 RepID=A0A5M3W972_9ACTN|nr:DISARM system phospholipase D-like protein DrmC [Acrocarpospora corrugata]GES05386.1 hypothetical protein Acor_74540 [Acrocarpospora corrugata]